MNCRHCSAPLTIPFVDLGSAPPSNAYLTASRLSHGETWFPLRVLVCDRCWLVQTEDIAAAGEFFNAEYAYFSAFSSSWLAHCERYVETMIRRFDLGAGSLVAEVAANDGYLLQFVKGRRIPCFGIEPTHSTAEAARARGIAIIEDFFGSQLAERLAAKGEQVDLVAANNVLAHVPDINDFVRGFATLLKPQGVATFEFPHLLRLMDGVQFDTIYHEHFSYLSLTAVQRIFGASGLSIFDVEEHSTHGGSLRVFAQRSDVRSRAIESRVGELLAREESAGMSTIGRYRGFQEKADSVKNAFLRFLLDAKRDGDAVAGYGAAAKGNTLLNYAGVRADLVKFVVDRNPTKQGKFLPGSRIPIVDEAHLRAEKPAYVVVFPWNLRQEIASQVEYIKEWGGRFVVAVPRLEIT